MYYKFVVEVTSEADRDALRALAEHQQIRLGIERPDVARWRIHSVDPIDRSSEALAAANISTVPTVVDIARLDTSSQ